MTMSDARKALEGATPPPAPPKKRPEPHFDDSVGAVTGVNGDGVYVTVGTAAAGPGRVCMLTSWDNDAETAATVALERPAVEALIDMLRSYRPYVGKVCEAHNLIDCEDCAAELEDGDQ
jgi:hypothetical protein